MVPKWFRPVAIVALMWNLLGCAAYLADVSLKPEDVAKLSAEQQALYAARPAWSVAATATAVWFGALGSLGLLLRKRWAFGLLVLSLLGIVGQDVWLFGLSRAASAAGAVAWWLSLPRAARRSRCRWWWSHRWSACRAAKCAPWASSRRTRCPWTRVWPTASLRRGGDWLRGGPPAGE